MKKTYYVWTTGEYMGQLKELNIRTAIQKAKIICRLHGKKYYAISTSSVPGLEVFAAGYSGMSKQTNVSLFKQIVDNLTQRKNHETM